MDNVFKFMTTKNCDDYIEDMLDKGLYE